jgi:hypothetical protein
MESNTASIGGSMPGMRTRIQGVHGSGFRKDDRKSELAETITCPVCGCNECEVVHKGSSELILEPWAKQRGVASFYPLPGSKEVLIVITPFTYFGIPVKYPKA